MPYVPTGSWFLDYTSGLEAITLKQPGDASGTAVAHAKRRAVSIKEAQASFGRYTSSDVKWRLSQSEYTSQPELGSKIIDAAGVYWTVLSVERAFADTEWACMTRALAIVAGLDCVVSIQRAAFEKDAAGASVSVFAEVSAVRARIQETGSAAVLESGLHLTRRTFEITVAEEVEIDNTCQIVGPDGTAYEFSAYERAETIDSLPLIRASLDPFPNV